jgi:phosphatidate cytidylyltransferase
MAALNMPATLLYVIFGVLSVFSLIRKSVCIPARVEAYLQYLWVYFLVFSAAELFSFTAAVWILAAVCFVALREYFSLLDIRLQDRWGILGAYSVIPFMTWLISIDFYSMFIITIPILTFLVIPLLVALGGSEAEGTVFSVGAIDFGLFLLVYCAGHVGYLMFTSTWLAALLVINVAICDGVAFQLASYERHPWRGSVLRYVVCTPLTAALFFSLAAWAGIPRQHALVIGVFLPLAVAAGRYTMVYIEADLGIAHDYETLRRGRLINSSSSMLFAAPVVFHYARYFAT